MIDANYHARAKEAYEEQQRECHMRISPTRFSAILIAGLLFFPAAIYYATSAVAGLLSGSL